MPIPEFNEFGLLPFGVYECSMEEVRTRYCSTFYRDNLFARLEKMFRVEPELNPVKSFFIDGSFITKKEIPGDIDIAVVVPDPQPEYWERMKMSVFSKEKHILVKLIYGVDLWPSCRFANYQVEKLFIKIKLKDISSLGIPDPAMKKGILLVTL